MVSDDLLEPFAARAYRRVLSPGRGGDGSATSSAAPAPPASTTSLDPGADPDERWQGGLAGLTPVIDQLLPNAVEACGLAGIDAVEAAASRCARSPRSGEAAAPTACWRWPAASRSRPRAHHRLVDTIGAGDSTDAGWLAARLGGRSLEQSVRLAAACGSLSTRARGGTASQPTLAEAEAAL